MIRKATIEDIKDMQELINFYAKQDRMLPRSLNELYETIRDFFVYEEAGKILGCCSLHIAWENLAEVKSLAVGEASQKKGIGAMLVREALEDAKKLKVKRVFALTYVPEFFERLGFKRIAHAELPHKIWSECIKCIKFPDCEENALALDI
ncbi:MAG: GNAT family N-acetyltransferase [Candidatus Omnitrophica bacterium CG22_combo_CG10-13_8_21_14_all_43_16]|nr:MAG: GNAT family N-acetyltransferase [Candidatus Omnitrophica bacterium CG22_combo_CG10-13_8_21_14_all_43_16]